MKTRTILLFLSISFLVAPVFSTSVNAAQDYYDQLQPAGEEIVACNFWRKANSDTGWFAQDTVYEQSQTYTIRKSTCDNLADQLVDPDGKDWDPSSGCYGDICAMEHEEEGEILSNSGFVGTRSGEGPIQPEREVIEDSTPWEGWVARTPPACPYDISKLSGSNFDYCRCGDKNYRVADGGKCTQNGPHPEDRLCENLENCGDRTVKEIFNFRRQFYGETDIPLKKEFQINLDQELLFDIENNRAGLYGLNTWIYIPEDNANVGIYYDTLPAFSTSLKLYRLDLSSFSKPSGSWDLNEYESFSLSGESVETFGELEEGWYLVDLWWGEEEIWGYNQKIGFTVDSANVNVGEIAETVNWNGPIPKDLNADSVTNTSEAKTACENNPYYAGDFADEWADEAWSEGGDRNRFCCANEPSEDLGRVNEVTGETCTRNGWDEVNKCIDETGSEIEGTDWSAELGECCGAQAGSENQEAEDKEYLSCDGSVYCNSYETQAECTNNGCTWEYDSQNELGEEEDGEEIEFVGGTCTGGVALDCSDYDNDESACLDETACSPVYNTTESESSRSDNYGEIYSAEEQDLACLKNRAPDPEQEPAPVLENDSTWYVWRTADGSDFAQNKQPMVVMEASAINEQYVGDGETIYTCNSSKESSIDHYETTGRYDPDDQMNSQAICFERSNQDVFRECCAGGRCANEEYAHLDSKATTPLQTYYVRSGDHHNDILKSSVVISELNRDGEALLNSSGEDGQYLLTNWSGYEEIELIYKHGNYDSMQAIGNSNLNMKFSNGSNAESLPLSEYTVDLSDSWFKTTLDVSQLSIDTTNIVRFGFTAETDEALSIELTDSYLKSETNMYCGAQGWNQSLNNDRAGCEAQEGYRWTGSSCCGSNTQHDNYGELYSDSNGACSYGEYVDDGELITDELLYYTEETIPKVYACQGLQEDLQYSQDGTPQGSFSDEVDLVRAEARETVGSYTCGLDGTWLEGGSNERQAILTAIFDKVGRERQTDYTIHCGDPQTVANVPGDLDDFTKACSLTLSDDSRDPKSSTYQSATGLIVPPQEEGQFDKTKVINTLTNLEPYSSVDNVEDRVNCEDEDNIETAEANFTECGTTYSEYHFYYNNDTGIYLISVEDLFQNSFSYNPVTWWNSVTNLFSQPTESLELDTTADRLFISRDIGDQNKKYVAYHYEDQQSIVIDTENMNPDDRNLFLTSYKPQYLERDATTFTNNIVYTYQDISNSQERQAWKSVTSVSRLGD